MELSPKRRLHNANTGNEQDSLLDDLVKAVIPAKAGIQFVLFQVNSWIPAFAGMTKVTFVCGIVPKK